MDTSVSMGWVEVTYLYQGSLFAVIGQARICFLVCLMANFLTVY